MNFAVRSLACLLFFVPALLAQTKESLLIGSGDLLHVQVFDTPELEQHARVTDSGELPLIMGGPVRVSGLAPIEASRVIAAALKDGHFLLTPRVLVTVEEYATQKVSVLGEVRVPGAYAIATPRSILDVLSLAGGLTEAADRKIIIQRRSSSQTLAYFVSNKPGTALDTAVSVNPGDTVLVPKAGIVYVLGDVRQPGGYTMTNNDAQLSILQLVARAGGINNTAVPSRARLIRRSASSYTEIPLQLSSMQKGSSPDLPLQPDDIVYVPFSYLRNFAASASGIAATIGSAAVYRF
jgi:polysaccharide export outer membrane protein